jgi:hypothetical protein
MKNLIIGTIKNYNIHDLKPFVLTLKKTGYAGDTVFFYSNVKEKTLQWLHELGIQTVEFGDKYPYLGEEYQDNTGVLPATCDRNIHVFSMRYIPYYLWLIKNKNKYQNIFFADTRDIIFQKDPFDFEMNNNIFYFCESENWPIKKSDFNAEEIRLAFGEDALNKIGDNLISNVGTVIGPSEKIFTHIEKMVGYIMAGDGSILMDQGTHNYIVWNNMIPETKVCKNGEGPVLTVGYDLKIHHDKNGNIIDKNGLVPNLVHQYDRHYWVAKDFYDWNLKIKYFYRLLKGYKVKINNKVSASLKAKYPKLHKQVKKLF